jgi:2,4-dienoyl-CoA reductase (NADPH2)
VTSTPIRGFAQSPTSGLSAFEMLLSPITIGHVTLRNRVVLLPTGTGYTNRGRVEEEDIAFNVRRAEGGVGLIITGGTTTDSSSQNRGRVFIEAYDPDVVPGLRVRAEKVHAAGAMIFGQLFNLGRHHTSDVVAGVPLAPSALRSHLYPFAPMAMGEREISQVTEGFALSAHHMAEAGCDGVEIHAAHSYLLAQFLARSTNRRTDGYGGTQAGRARLLIETLRSVRAAVGHDFVVGVRLSVDDETVNGTTVEESLETVGLLENEGTVDYLSLAVGVRGKYVKDASNPDGVALERIGLVKRESKLPVIASQRIRRPGDAEEALRRGDADLIGMSRALIADPDWVNKVQSNTPARIRPCVGDMQDCRNHLAGGLGCMVNPSVGRQHVLDSSRGELPVTAPSLRVAVIGGGPAGLESARRTALQGHDVTLYEATSRLGGQVLLAALNPARGEFLEYISFLEAELAHLGVNVVTNRHLDVVDVADLRCDLIVIATGATGSTQGDTERGHVDSPPSVALWDLLGGADVSNSNDVVVLDDGSGDWPTLTGAILLSHVDRNVTIVTSSSSIVRTVPTESVAGVLDNVEKLDVRWLTSATAVTPFEGGLEVLRAGWSEPERLRADLVVEERGRTPNDELWRTLSKTSLGPPVWVAVGDCLSPRDISHAVRDAADFALKLQRGTYSSKDEPMDSPPLLVASGDS